MLFIKQMILLCWFLFVPAASSDSTTPVKPEQQAIYSQMDIHHPVWAKNGMVATQEALATQIGVDILQQGGNAVDAAVAVGYALAVTLPRAGNLGGGGFMLLYLAEKKQTIAIDYREKAPAKATPDMYLDNTGNVINSLSRYHGLAVGIPGTVMGLELAREKYGSMSRQALLTPAIKLATEGIKVTADLANSLQAVQQRLTKWDSTKTIFYKDNGTPYQAGEILQQKELANSLKRISEQGANGFYQGYTAQQIALSVAQAGGIISTEDLKNYRAIERQPLRGTYRGYDIIAMPPPSSGGVHILQMLNMLENYPLAKMGHNSAATIHVMAETMRRAYADRSLYLGDSDFVKVPLQALTDKKYAQHLVKQIDLNKASLSTAVMPGELAPYESSETTHFSIMDKWGNAVANTYTLNFSYGSGLVADGTGILLNNEMDDFSAKPGEANSYGLIGGKANAIAANKRPLSSMSPTIILRDNQPFLVTGTPGGSRIISTTLQMILNVLDFEMNIAEASAALRIHHQWLPDYIRVEKGLNTDTINLLKSKGHIVKVEPAMGSTQSILKNEDGFYGASDPRKANALSKGY